MRKPLLAGFSSLVLLAAPVLGQCAEGAQTDSRPDEDPTIVVTAVPPAELKSQHEACLAAGCAVRDDTNTSLAYAEALFVQGDYRAARGVVRASLGRNGRAAPQEPKLVAMLYRASSRLSAHLGQGEQYWTDAHQIVRAFKSAPEQDQAEILLSELEVADMSLKMRDPTLAERMIEKVVRDARAAGLTQIEQVAILWRAMLPVLAWGQQA